MAEIIISGMGVICSLGNNPEELADGLFKGKPGITQTTFGTKKIPACLGVAKQTDEEAGKRDRTFTMCDKAVKQALESTDSRDIGLVCASSLGGILSAEKYLTKQINSGDTAPGHLMDYPLPALGHYLVKRNKLAGPVISFSTACTSAFSALGYALELLYEKSLNKVLVCAVDTLCRTTTNGFHAIGASSKQPARPFDHDRKGLNLGEAGAAVLLECKDSDWLSDGTLKIGGYGLTNDAFHLTAPHRDGKGLMYSIEMALQEAKMNAREIDIVHTHGTGTKYNDLMELKVLEQLFSSVGKTVPAFSTKGQLGHTLGPSGLVALVSSCLILEKGFIPGTRNFEQSELDLKHILLGKQSKQCSGLKNILILASGFTGHNAALILKKTG